MTEPSAEPVCEHGQTTAHVAGWMNSDGTETEIHCPGPEPEPSAVQAQRLLDDAVALMATNNAMVWAKQFCALFGNETVEPGLMVGWFANAMMAHEFALGRADEDAYERGRRDASAAFAGPEPNTAEPVAWRISWPNGMPAPWDLPDPGSPVERIRNAFAPSPTASTEKVDVSSPWRCEPCGVDCVIDIRPEVDDRGWAPFEVDGGKRHVCKPADANRHHEGIGVIDSGCECECLRCCDPWGRCLCPACTAEWHDHSARASAPAQEDR